MNKSYNKDYYNLNKQNKDRFGLFFYSNLLKNNLDISKHLDLGCGVGFLLKKLEKIKKNLIIYGLEINDYAIEEAKKNTNKSIIVKDINKIEEKLTSVSLLHIVEHIDDQNLSILFSKIITKLEQNGKILIATPCKNGLAHKIKKDNWIAYNDKTHINLKTELEWKDFFKKNKLKILKEGNDGLWDFPYNSYIYSIKFIKIYFIMIVQILFGKLYLKSKSGETYICILEIDDKVNY